MKVAIILAILSVALAYEYGGYGDDGEDSLWRLVDRFADIQNSSMKWTFSSIKRNGENINITIRDMMVEGAERVNITKIIANGTEVIDYDVTMTLLPVRVSGKVNYKIREDPDKERVEGTFNFVAFPKESFDYYVKVMVATYWNATKVSECRQSRFVEENMRPIVDCQDGPMDICNRVHWEIVYANWLPFENEIAKKVCDIVMK